MIEKILAKSWPVVNFTVGSVPQKCHYPAKQQNRKKIAPRVAKSDGLNSFATQVRMQARLRRTCILIGI